MLETHSSAEKSLNNFVFSQLEIAECFQNAKQQIYIDSALYVNSIFPKVYNFQHLWQINVKISFLTLFYPNRLKKCKSRKCEDLCSSPFGSDIR